MGSGSVKASEKNRSGLTLLAIPLAWVTRLCNVLPLCESSMLSRLFGRPHAQADTAAALYGAIVAQARRPGFYAHLGVPDTVSGRFEMVLLHTVLVLRRLQEGGPAEA